jgi:hypothetical protein
MFERAAEIQERLDRLKMVGEQHAILEAAMQCRCVIVRQSDEDGAGERMLLVAHGQVLSVRNSHENDTSAVVRWIRAHNAVIGAVERQQSEIDAASVLERWLVCNRNHVRWVAIPPDATEDDLLDRVDFILGEADKPAGAGANSRT